MEKNVNGKVTQTINPKSQKISSSTSSEKVTCMKGSIFPQKDRGRWAVSWYCSLEKRSYVITRYNDHFMHITCYKTSSDGRPLLDEDGYPIPDEQKCIGYKIAGKLLADIQRRWEQHLSGICQFRIEEFIGRKWAGVNEFFEDWLKTKAKKKPATYKGYKSYYRNWIKPFFQEHQVMLHEIQLDTLDKLLDSIQLSPKGKYNVMNCFHAFMDYAWRSRKIPEMPPFPKKSDYQLVNHTIKWLSEKRQMDVINAIPEIHQPIFLWLKYHLRRPSEACALHVEDFDPFNMVFNIQRAISARRLVDSTKTYAEHVIPCHPNFEQIALKHVKKKGKFFFTNPLARKDGKRYTNESLNRIWKKACKQVGEDIDLYSGLKHSSCSQYINEKGMSLTDLQAITDHASIESVRKYAKMEVSRKRELMSCCKVIPIQERYKKQKESK
jgi:integrase